jgi:protein-tyrosine-phosphatase
MQIYNVLFLCTANTARSILAEAILRKDGAGHFNAFSAASQPKGTVIPFATGSFARSAILPRAIARRAGKLSLITAAHPCG